MNNQPHLAKLLVFRLMLVYTCLRVHARDKVNYTVYCGSPYFATPSENVTIFGTIPFNMINSILFYSIL